MNQTTDHATDQIIDHDEKQPLDRLMTAHGWTRPDGAIDRASSFWAEPMTAILALAAAGFFPTTAWVQQAIAETAFEFLPQQGFAARPYQIRLATLADLPALLQLEAECWVEPLRATPAELQQRLQGYPAGHYLLTMQGQAAGVIYSQRIADATALQEHTFRDVAALHVADGPIVQALAVNVLPAKQSYGLGDQLLEFLLQLATLQPDVARVVAVTLCKTYAEHTAVPMEEYIHLRNAQGHLLDPILNFHAAHGAKVRQLINGYRPADLENQGKGVLVEYDLPTRLAQRRASLQLDHTPADRSKLHAALPRLVDEAIQATLGAERTAAFTRQHSLMELGLTSFELLELRTHLSQRLGVEVEPTFFFRYGTAQAIIDYFRQDTPSSPPAAPPPRSQDGAIDGFRDNGSPLASIQERSNAMLAASGAESIAIIGMACRFPGAVTTPEEFWTLLANGVDAITEVPKTRWDIDAYYGEGPGKIRTRYGGFIDGVDGFDAPFFRIAPVEAAALDPQQRLLLETHWEALEQAGIAPSALQGSETGIYVGIFSDDYKLLQTKQPPSLGAYFGTGTFSAVAAGRIAYFLGVHGPALAVDTACSSSLVAVHLACQSLRSGECNVALASGVNLLLSPELSIAFSQANMLSPDGRCKTFDAAANGYVRSEGCGVVVLKRLRDAVADGDNILAVVRGSAINQDGASNGLTAPNGLAQKDVLGKALAAAQLQPQTIAYVEAHGTGTSLGDPLEMSALQAVYGAGRDDDNLLLVGSVKTNIGHTEAAAGIAGLIKVVLALQHRYIPAHLHLRALNPYLATSRIKIANQGQPWRVREDGQPRRAGISAFGFSGTNAHVILEEAPPIQATEKWVRRPYHLLTLSAKSEGALQELARRYQVFLAHHPEAALDDLCATTQSGRSHFAYRLSVSAASAAELQAKLNAYMATETVTGLNWGQVAEEHQRQSTAFLFTGQGAQYVQMGRELYATSALFRATLDRCDELLQPLLGQSLAKVLYPQSGNQAQHPQSQASTLIDQTTYTQPALFALEYALATLWQAWGIQPDIVMGHSVGEVVAACVAGVFSLEDALRLIAARGRLMGALNGAEGAMVALLAKEAHVQAAIAAYPTQVSIAAVNGPQNVVISGQRATVQQIVEQLSAAGVKAHPLTVSHAFHSPLMEPMLAEFAEIARTIDYQAPRLPLISNLTGRLVTDEVTDWRYWVRHVREAVRFADGVQTLLAQDVGMLIEIGPKPTLLGMVRAIAEHGADHPVSSGNPLLLPSLRAERSDWQQLLESLGALYVRGMLIDWECFNREHQPRKLALPTYPFQRQRHWLAANPLSMQPRQHETTVRPLIDKMMQSPAVKETIFETAFGVERLPFLADHRVYDAVVSPGACQLALVLNAAELIWGQPACQLDDVIFPTALLIPDGKTRTVQAIFTPLSADHATPQSTFNLISFAATARAATEQPATHASGALWPLAKQPPAPIAIDRLRQRCQEVVDFSALYADAGQPLRYGPTFRWLDGLWRNVTEPGELLGHLALPTAVGDQAGYLLHPGLLDACFQIIAVAQQDAAAADAVQLPFALEALRFYATASGREWWCHARQVTASKWAFQLLDSGGQVIAEVDSYTTRAAPLSALQSARLPTDWLYTTAWVDRPLAAAPTQAPNCWLLFGANTGVSAALGEALAAAGMPTFLVTPDLRYTLTPPAPNGQLQRATVDPSAPEMFKTLLTDLARDYQSVGIVYLWGMEQALPAATGPEQVLDLCAGVLHLVQAVLASGLESQLWLVTEACQPAANAPLPIVTTQSSLAERAVSNALWGLGRTIALEHPELRCCCVDLEQGAVAQSAALLQRELLAGTADPRPPVQVAYQHGMRQVATLRQWQPPALADAHQPQRVQLSEYGSVDYLTLTPLQRQAPGPGQVEVEVRAAGLNFRDVLNALGMLQSYYADVLGVNQARDVGIGYEYAGVVSAVGAGVTAVQVGDRVMGVGGLAGNLASYLIVTPAQMARIPDHLSFCEAATIPFVYLTAWYGLVELARLQAGERVLIHAAAGGVGLAAVQIAQAIGAEVFATASPGKWDFLRQQGVAHVMNSRTLDFAAQIEQLTTGAGVDVVLNSLNGAFIDPSFDVLRPQGRFVELGKLGARGHAEVAEQRPDVGYFPFDLVEALLQDESLQSRLWQALADLLNTDRLKPLPYVVFPVQQIVDACRWMQQAKHIGKIVIGFEPPRRVTLHPTASYLITGGVGALGLQIAQQLAADGVRQLVLASRRGLTDAAVQASLDQLQAQGVAVKIVQADMAEQADVQRLLAICAEMGPLRGIVHAAGLLDDGVLAQQSLARFATVLRPKVHGAWHLHCLTSGLDLDFFVCFSSVAALLGAPGQSNYAAANAFMDALMQQRRRHGLPGLSINWGPWAEAGMAADLQTRLQSQGLSMIAPHQGRLLFQALLQHAIAQIGVAPIHWPVFLQQGQAASFLLTDFAHQNPPGAPTARPAAPSLRLRWRQASAKEQMPLLIDHLRQLTATILGWSNPSQIDVQAGLMTLGMDSLMAVELRNQLAKSLECRLPATVLFEYPSLAKLATYLQTDVLAQLEPAAVSQAVPSTAGHPAPVLTTQPSDEDAMTRLIAAELAQLELELENAS